MRDYGGRDAASSDLVLLAACAAIALVAYALPRSWAAGISSSVQSTVLRPVVTLQARAAQDRTSRFRLDDIQSARDSLALLVMADSSVRRENADLRRLLGLRASPPVRWIPAQTLHRPTPTDARVIMLDAGSNRGVARYQPVLTPDGVLGYIWSVSSNASSVQTWMHPDWRASAVTGDGAIMGILAPSTVGSSGQQMLELRGVALRDSLIDGTIVYTSGLGGVYPRMIPVGTVVGVGADPMGYERVFRVAPFVVPGLANQVMVLQGSADSLLMPPGDTLP
jgi:cell shape-determining protein MreC